MTPARYAHLRRWPAAALGLGFLLLLIGYTGLVLLDENRKFEENVFVMSKIYRQRQQVHSEMRDDLYQSAILLRDVAFARDATSADDYRRRLRERRAAMEARIESYASSQPAEFSSEIARLRTALSAYWNVLARAVELVGSGGAADFRKVRDQVTLQRQSLEAVADELKKLETETFLSEQHLLRTSLAQRRRALRNNLMIAVVAGTLALVVALWRLSSLQRKAGAT